MRGGGYVAATPAANRQSQMPPPLPSHVAPQLTTIQLPLRGSTPQPNTHQCLRVKMSMPVAR